MKSRLFPLFVLGFYCACFSATTFTGLIVDNNSPVDSIANATISLQVNGSSTFSGAGGLFSLTLAGTDVAKPGSIGNSALHVSGTTLCFSIASSEKVRISLFNMAGRDVGTVLDRTFDAGSYTLSLPELMQKKVGPGLYIVRILKGAESLVGTFMSMGPNGGMVTAGNSLPGFGRSSLAKTTATVDSLIVYRMGYVQKSVPITAYTTQDLGTIVLTWTAEEALVEHKADSVLALMTIAEKAGQMVQTQINNGSETDRLTDAQYASMAVGSVFNGGSDPSINGTANSATVWSTMIDRIQTAITTNSRLKIPMIYGQDCVHGAAEIAGATVFPHDIGLGCTHDSALVAQIGRDVAAECAGTGIRLTFAPCIASVRDECWGRTFEGFGETPEINVQMGSAYVRGLQGDGDLSQTGAISASAKHFLGDGATKNGVNNDTAWISDSTMHAVHFPQYAACARQNVSVVMISYSTWVHDGKAWAQAIDPYTMTTLLKRQAGFDGFCLSDWDGLPTACGAYNNSCVASAINAGMDMVMIVGNVNPNNFIQAVVADVGNNTIPIARVNDAVKRILRIKFRMHLWDRPLSNATLRSQVFSPAHQADARQAVRESMVLLTNTGNALPLKTTDKVVVVGPFANDMGAQCGGWTISWQGQTGNTWSIAGQTILTGLQAAGGANVTYSSNGTAISGADKIVVVVGENPYAEGQGDVTVPNFSAVPNYSLIQTCVSNSGGKPVILVMLTGRPMLLTSPATSCQAIVEAWLPGSEGGGVADVLYGGTYNFTGTLTHTWPATAAQIPINAGPVYSDEQHGTGGTPMFAYGFGLKY